MIEVVCEQLSPEWFAHRRGIPTSSQFSRIMTSTGGRSKQWDDYAREVAGERLATFQVPAWAGNADTKRGIRMEPRARTWYEFDREVRVRQVGLLLHDCRRFGASTDGLIDADQGVLEIKCPNPKEHGQTLLTGKVPAGHLAQVHGALVVTGWQWVDFVSYCPGLKEVVIRVTPNDLTERLRLLLELFCDDVDRLVPILAA